MGEKTEANKGDIYNTFNNKDNFKKKTPIIEQARRKNWAKKT